VLAADLNHRVARLRLPQYTQNLLFAMTLLRHLQAPLIHIQRTPTAWKLSASKRLSFGFWVIPWRNVCRLVR
jgi:hypothetical protein